MAFALGGLLWLVIDVLLRAEVGYLIYCKYIFIVLVIYIVIEFFINTIIGILTTRRLAKALNLPKEKIIAGFYVYKMKYDKKRIWTKKEFILEFKAAKALYDFHKKISEL